MRPAKPCYPQKLLNEGSSHSVVGWSQRFAEIRVRNPDGDPDAQNQVKEILMISTIFGGDGGIRTLGKELSLRRFSKPLVSATHPRLRMARKKRVGRFRAIERRAIARAIGHGNGHPGKFLRVTQFERLIAITAQQMTQVGAEWTHVTVRSLPFHVAARIG